MAVLLPESDVTVSDTDLEVISEDCDSEVIVISEDAEETVSELRVVEVISEGVPVSPERDVTDSDELSEVPGSLSEAEVTVPGAVIEVTESLLVADADVLDDTEGSTTQHSLDPSNVSHVPPISSTRLNSSA